MICDYGQTMFSSRRQPRENEMENEAEIGRHARIVLAESLASAWTLSILFLAPPTMFRELCSASSCSKEDQKESLARCGP